MAKHASELVRGMGAAAHLIQYFSEHLADEEFYYLVTESGKETLDKMLTLAHQEYESSVGNPFQLQVTDKSKEELVYEGKYDFLNADFLSKTKFVKTGEGTEEVYIIEKRLVDPEAALEDLKERGYEPLDTAHLLHFGIQFPRVQMSKWPIVAIGDLLKTNDLPEKTLSNLAPSLSWGESGRRLGLVFVRDWAQCWVLCRKIK